MSFVKLVMAGASALCILTSVASADPLTGRVTGINRLTNTISIQQTQDGTIGTTIGASEEFKAREAVSEDLHVGERVIYSVTESGGMKTITKIELQK